MKTLREIVSLYKYEEGIYTDEAAASSLGCTKQAFSNYLRGDRRMPDVAIMKLAHGTGVSVDEIITAINLNLKTTDEHERSYWLERATDYAAVIAGVLIGVTAISPRNADAAPRPAANYSDTSLYIMSTLRRMFRWLMASRLNPAKA